MKYLIREAIDKDIKKINEIFIEMNNYINKIRISNNLESIDEFKNGYPSNFLEEYLKDKNKKILVVDFNNTVIGYLSLEIYKDEDYCYIDDFCIDEKYRGKGIGSSLIEESIKITKEYKINNIRLHVFSFNTQAIKLYTKYDFNEISRENNRLLLEKRIDYEL